MATSKPSSLMAGTLYLGDNGRAFCWRLACSGASAYFTGRDRSGDRVEVVMPADAKAVGLRCEACGFQPEGR